MQEITKPLTISSDKTHVFLNHELPMLDFVHCKTILTSHMDKILSIAIWKNRYVLTGSIDDHIHMYDMTSGKKICQYPSYGDPVCSLEIIENPQISYLCFSNLCQCLFLMNLPKKTLIRQYNHSSDIMMTLNLRNNRNIIFADLKGQIYCWDFRKNQAKEIETPQKNQNFQVSGMKFLGSGSIGISSCSENKGQMLILRMELNFGAVKGFEVLRSFDFDERLCSLNFGQSLNTIVLGMNAGLKFLNLGENSIKEHKLFCLPSTINEIVVLEGKAGDFWGVMVNDLDRKLFIVDFKKGINFEVKNPLISVYYFSVKSKMQLFERKGKLYLGLVSQEAEIVVIYEILFPADIGGL